MTNRTFCSCGRRLESKVTRQGVLLRCPEHGIQFRYTVVADSDETASDTDESGAPKQRHPKRRPPFIKNS